MLAALEIGMIGRRQTRRLKRLPETNAVGTGLAGDAVTPIPGRTLSD
jgi:hypothetical protein